VYVELNTVTLLSDLLFNTIRDGAGLSEEYLQIKLKLLFWVISPGPPVLATGWLIIIVY